LEYSIKKMGASYYNVFSEAIDETEPKVNPIPWANFKAIIINTPTWPRFTPKFIKKHFPTEIKFKIKRFLEF